MAVKNTIFVARDGDVLEFICASTSLKNIIEALCDRYYIQSCDKIYGSIPEHEGESLYDAFGKDWREVLKNRQMTAIELSNLFDWEVSVDEVEVV